MVFHYTIRGGQCRHSNSHLHLSSDDITCYVGRDKHENEFLIQYGWPGDIWFHVEGLSSAHVYFRVMIASNPKIPLDGIPIDDLPGDSVEDMKQIVKHNSISGCKLASCKIVWTPHSNLKKTFEMDSGTVTYHNTKLCRYGRCDKDRVRIKELEKTKRERHNVNYYEEMKANERKLIERRKKERQSGGGVSTELYDPIQADEQAMNLKGTRQGDDLSGLDTGLAQLEGLTFGDVVTHHPATGNAGNIHGNKAAEGLDDAEQENAENADDDDHPIWMKESESRMKEKSEKIRFLRERGYCKEDVLQMIDVDSSSASLSAVQLLAKLWKSKSGTALAETSMDIDDAAKEEIQDLQQQEHEVLRAIFMEDDDGVQFAGKSSEDEGYDPATDFKFDAILPITAYEPPERYGMAPPPLLLEIYVDNGISPLYPLKGPPVLALVGGGLPEQHLQKLTDKVRNQTYEQFQEEPGEPQIFNLVGYVGEIVETILEEELNEIQKVRKQKLEELKAAAAEARRKELELKKEQGEDDTEQSQHQQGNFKSEAERRQYAKDMIANGVGVGISEAAGKDPSSAPKKTKKHYDTGVSDQKLIEDLFG